MLISDRKISKAQLRYINEKTEKRLSTWQCDYLSSGGKLILTKSCLSSIQCKPWRYIISMKGIFMDSIRSKFFWQGTGKNRKYHMIKYKVLNRPKEFGGLSFFDVRAMNVYLLVKLIDRLQRGDSSLCRSNIRDTQVLFKSRQGKVHSFGDLC